MSEFMDGNWEKINAFSQTGSSLLPILIVIEMDVTAEWIFFVRIESMGENISRTVEGVSRIIGIIISDFYLDIVHTYPHDSYSQKLW